MRIIILEILFMLPFISPGSKISIDYQHVIELEVNNRTILLLKTPKDRLSRYSDVLEFVIWQINKEQKIYNTLLSLCEDTLKPNPGYTKVVVKFLIKK